MNLVARLLNPDAPAVINDWQQNLSRDYFAEFRGETAIIAGGAGHIGSTLADALHWLGAKVAIVDRDGDRANACAKALAARRNDGFPCFAPLALTADIADEAARKTALADIVEQFGTPRYLINTTSQDEQIGFERVDQGRFERSLADNFIGPFMLAKECIELMRSAGQGAICLFSSRHGSEVNMPETAGYGTAKAALDNGITRLAVYAGQGNTPGKVIRVFGFSPCWVLNKAQKHKNIEPIHAAAVRKQLIPVAVTPRDLAAPVLFNLSARAGTLTGRTIYHDAGEGQRP